ncbi:lysM and putative peptidoglycan-binding domain-containing protein 4 [Latimeria chalumnae]|uniref:LysM and putative peptidoglycan-binding domain-containing protein 4 n=1 Tax=Latimeria chalumnae TaxID=7897 RepID=H3BCB9_LATCH|nr:PREDICTED: lysM and putative peptidoglycan-binding domain-containing protein 4 [Latimeria chalumnae]|eukprot:XP_005990190.1 PREDICTED: lysM and putative peptidoglycan-binding domain-containing protein 4 [Latimeria chalumnae]
MKLKDGLARSFQGPVDVHASQSGHVYVFRNGTSDLEASSEEEFDIMELRPRGREQQSINALKGRVGDVVLLQREITEEDNLNKLALQYGCKVADIKQVNNLLKEQDLYALKSIKIPVKKHGILTESNKELKQPQIATTNSGRALTELSENSTTGWGIENTDLTEYFKGIDQDIGKLIQSTDEPKGELNEVLSSGLVNGPLLGTTTQKDRHHGADWGIQWWNAVLIMLLVGIILPIFYVVYFKIQENGISANPLNKTVFATTSLALEKNYTVFSPESEMEISTSKSISSSLQSRRIKRKASDLG